MSIIISDMRDNIDGWKGMYDSSTPQNFRYPSPLDILDGLDRMVVLRTLRPDKVLF